MDVKAILGNAYTEELEKAINAAVGKEFVPRAEFNAKNEEAKTAATTVAERDKQLEELKKAAANDAETQKKIAEMQETNKVAAEKHQAELDERDFNHLVDIELLGHSPVSLKALKAELDLSKVKRNGDKLEGLTEQIEAIKAGELKALFKAQEQTPPIRTVGISTGSQGGVAIPPLNVGSEGLKPWNKNK